MAYLNDYQKSDVACYKGSHYTYIQFYIHTYTHIQLLCRHVFAKNVANQTRMHITINPFLLWQ